MLETSLWIAFWIVLFITTIRVSGYLYKYILKRMGIKITYDWDIQKEDNNTVVFKSTKVTNYD